MRMFVRVCMHAHSHVCMHAHSHSHTCILQTHVYMRVHRYVCMYMNTDTHVFVCSTISVYIHRCLWGGVATIGRLLEILRLFCKRIP